MENLDQFKLKYFNYQFKILLLGDIGTGKSCMRLQFVQKRLPQIYQKTNYIQYAAKTIIINSIRIKLQLWDFGQNAFRNTLKLSNQPQNCIGILLIFSILSYDSFKIAVQWLKYQKNRYHPFTKVYLIGNKSDQSSMRTVFRKDIDQIVTLFKISYYQISSKQFSDVYKVFIDMASQIYKQIQQGIIQINYKKYGVKQFHQNYNGLTLYNQPHIRKANCC